jgi:hypothetical protein
LGWTDGLVLVVNLAFGRWMVGRLVWSLKAVRVPRLKSGGLQEACVG